MSGRRKGRILPTDGIETEKATLLRAASSASPKENRMQIAIVGCGFVADFYLKTLPLQRELTLVGVMDRDADRASRFSAHYSVPAYPSFEALLEDERVDIVVNLTNPSSHFTVSKACLEAGKHVYSEKPLALRFSEARELVELAESKGLQISSAPCTFLNESAQTMWKALRENRIGTARLVYAEMDDGLVHRTPYRKWVSESGTPWPYKDEFEVGCTIEHAGYAVTWLSGFFGPAQSVTAFSACLIPDKQTDVPLDVATPDFSVACVKFRSGVVARLTCSIVAPRNHSLKIFGDEGVLCVDDLWNDRSPVYMKRMITIRRRTILTPWKRKYPLVGRSNPQARYRGAQQRNFCRGIAELATAVRERRSPRLAARYCLHNTEIVLAIQGSVETGAAYAVSSSFDPIEPMPYSRV
jgi:predicted dehydrogenase